MIQQNILVKWPKLSVVKFKEENRRNYTTYWPDYLRLTSNILLKRNKPDQALTNLLKIESFLESESVDTRHRDNAKLFLVIADLQLSLRKLNQAEDYVLKGFCALVPNFRAMQKLPNYWQLYDENTLIDLLKIEAQVYYEKSKNNHQKKYLDSAVLCIERAYRTNELIRNKFINRMSNYGAARDNKVLLNLSMNYLNDLFEITNDTKYVNYAVDFAKRTKSLIFSIPKKQKHCV